MTGLLSKRERRVSPIAKTEEGKANRVRDQRLSWTGSQYEQNR